MALSADSGAIPTTFAQSGPHISFRSRNLEQTHEFLYGKDLCFDVARRDAQALDVRISGVYLPQGLYVGLTEYGAKASIEATPRRTDYWLLIPLEGRMETTVHRHRYVSDPRRAFLFSYPSMGPSRIMVDAGAARIMVVLSYASLRRQLAALLDSPQDASLNPPLEFAPVVDLTRGHGRSIARLARIALADFERGGSMARNPLALSSFEQYVINELLLSHSHNYSEAIYGRQPSIGPRDVKRAIDFIEANLQAPIALSDIIDAAGVPGRTLLKHFESFRGVSPMQYMRAARLERVHAALREGDLRWTVSDIAMTWGFNHTGRFSAAYRRRFGERPSQTRKRSR
jgi:AraC-like DNA-binding protein